MPQFRNLRRRNGSADDDKQRDGRKLGKQTNQHQQAAHHLERTDEVRGESGMREANPSEAVHAHVRINVLEEALAEKDQPDCNAE